MIAVDTNVLVRLIVGDDAAQLLRARTVFESHEVWIATTVLLETIWVLRGSYGIDTRSIVEALRAVLGLPSVATPSAADVERAFEAALAGVDLADALHVALLPSAAQAFVTFDRSLVRRAKRLGSIRLA